MEFVGDGRYIGEGGKDLQRLWNSLTWKEIPKCPGRYVVKSSRYNSFSLSVRNTSLEDLLNHLEISPVTKLSIERPDSRDDIEIARFRGGGGVISYCKKERGDIALTEDQIQPEYVFVHTLNTESGLIRKLEGLKISILALKCDANRTEDIAAEIITKIIGYLEDLEKNRSATVLVRWFQSKLMFSGRFEG